MTIKTSHEGYCVKCKTTRIMNNRKRTKTKNGRNIIKGNCPKCKTKMCRMVK